MVASRALPSESAPQRTARLRQNGCGDIGEPSSDAWRTATVGTTSGGVPARFPSLLHRHRASGLLRVAGTVGNSRRTRSVRPSRPVRPQGAWRLLDVVWKPARPPYACVRSAGPTARGTRGAASGL